MADGTEASRRVREVLSGIKGMIGTVGGALGAAADLAESNLPVGAIQVSEDTAYVPPIRPGVGAQVYYLNAQGSWYNSGEFLGLTQTNQLFPVSETAPTGGGGGMTYDPLEGLREQQLRGEIEQAASEEARAAEMQPYDIANVQSQIEDRRAAEEYNQKNLERQMLSDRFARARDAFEAANLAEQLAVEKKKTATSFLTSIVDNLVPPGMEHPPGLGDQPWPTVAQIDWSQLGGGLDPQTDQALQYLLGMQQQNAGV